jgi:hypothetical protein
MCVTIDGVWLVIGFIEHLYTQLVTSSNYSAIANSHSAIRYSTILSLLSLLYLHLLSPSNCFQRRSFLSFRVHVLTGRRLSQLTQCSNWPSPRPVAVSHQPPTLLTAVSGLSRNRRCSSLYSLGKDLIENSSPNISPNVESRSYRTDRVENTVSLLLQCCGLHIYCLVTDVFREPFLSNGCLCWLRSSFLEPICHNILFPSYSLQHCCFLNWSSK